VLLDLVRHRGADVFLEHGNPITPEELEDVVRSQGVTIGRGDIVLIRTGWWARFLMTGNKTEPYSGLDWQCASWLHDHDVAAIAADNLQVEDPVSGVEGVFLPFHLLTLRDMGLMLGEYWDLTALAADCAADGVYEFQLIAPPLSIVGAVGSPVNPIAIK
jgi:kynurenine formamidase